MITFTLQIDPLSVQFGGKRVMVRGGKPVFFKQQHVIRWEQSVEWLAAPYRPEKPLEGALEMEVMFVLKRPKSMQGKKFSEWRIWMTKRPDVDNLQKGLQDALKGFWLDDSQIVKLHLSKCYTALNEGPKIEIKINQL